MVTTTRLTAPVTPTKYRFNVEQYYKMAELGILDMEQRTELIAGEIIEMSPIGTKHAICVSNLSELLTLKTIQFAHVRQQNPVHLSDRSEPQPDIALVKRPSSLYVDSHPQPADIFLLVEVSDSTLKYDRETKIPLYTSVGIPEVWIVNIEGQVVEVYRLPNGEGYQEMRSYGRSETILLFAVAIAVDQIF